MCCPNVSTGFDQVITQALSRLTERETYDRSWRFKRASQYSILHSELPKDQWISPSEVRESVLLHGCNAPHITTRTSDTSPLMYRAWLRRTAREKCGTIWKLRGRSNRDGCSCTFPTLDFARRFSSSAERPTQGGVHHCRVNRPELGGYERSLPTTRRILSATM